MTGIKPYVEYNPSATVHRLRVEIARSYVSREMLEFGTKNPDELRRLAKSVSGIDVPAAAAHRVERVTILEVSKHANVHIAYAVFYWE